MAWFDLLGGLAGGLNQGLGQVQQQQEQLRRSTQQERELALRALQEQRAQEEAELQAAQAAYNAAEPGNLFDPADPTVQKMLKRLGPAAFTKGPDGKSLTKKMSAGQQKAELELGEFQAAKPLREAELKAAMENVQFQHQMKEQFAATHGADWMRRIPRMSLPERQMAAIVLGQRPNTFLRPDESEAVMAAGITAAAMKPQRDALAANYNDQQLSNMRQQFNQYLTTPAGKLEMATQFMNNPEGHFQAWLQRMQGSGVAPKSMQVGKYTVSE